MPFVAQIMAAYNWAFAHIQTEMAAALTDNNQIAEADIERRRDVLDRGTYVLLFGQFELAVNQAFSRAHDRRRSNPDWTHRRGWDMPALSGDRVPFETRLSLTLDRKLPAFGKALSAYGHRNHCAHGGTTVAVGSIPQLASDIRSWERQLKSS